MVLASQRVSTVDSEEPSNMAARLFLVTLVVMVARSVRSAPQEAVVFDSSKIYFGNESRFVDPVIRFSELTANSLPSVRTKKMPKCVELGSTEEDPCTTDEDYDESIRSHVTQLIQRNVGLKALVSDPTLSNLLNDSLLFNQPSTRFGNPDVTQESPVCLSQETIIYPKRAKTPKDDWVFVVNQDNVQQAIRVEKCISEGHDCKLGMPLQEPATAKCRQKYVYKRMLTVGSNVIEPEEVLMPSCCVCYTNNPNFDISSRVKNITGKPAMTSPKRTAFTPVLHF